MSNKIFSMIPKVMSDVGAIGKNGTNTYDNYKFRSIDDVYNKLQPALAKNGVFFVPTVLETVEEKGQSKSGGAQVRVKQKIRYTIYADDGSSIESIVEGEAIDRSDKATNKAMTAALKYMLIQVFCIAVDGLDDADKDSEEISIDSKKTIEGAKKEGVIQNQSGDLSTFKMLCGNTNVKGKMLKDIDLFQLKSCVDYFLNQGKELTGTVKVSVHNAQIWLKQNQPPSLEDENLPF